MDFGSCSNLLHDTQRAFGSKTALDEVMSRLNWEDENEKKYKVSKEIAEHEIGRKVST